MPGFKGIRGINEERRDVLVGEGADLVEFSRLLVSGRSEVKLKVSRVDDVPRRRADNNP